MNHWAGAPTANPHFGAERAPLPLRSQVRLRMKGRPAAHGLDGAWWPRSRDPALEFPELVHVMSSWVGPVSRVVYRVDDWTAAEGVATSDGWPFELEGSEVSPSNTVVVIGTHQRRRSLLVVPPRVPGRVARAVLSWTAGPDAVDSAEQALMITGIVPPGSAAADHVQLNTQRT